MGYIYMLKNKINGKIYIGQTIRPIHRRFKEHRLGKSSECVAIYRAIQYHGWENFEKDYYYCPDEDLNFDEELLVREMDTLSPGGYNLKTGGGCGKMSEETKQKMSESHFGEKNHNYGKTPSDETKQKLREGRLGKPHTEETKKEMSKTRKGENNHNSKRLYQYGPDGTFINSFGSSGEAARHLVKICGSKIRACARGVKGYKTAYGFKWSYVKI